MTLPVESRARRPGSGQNRWRAPGRRPSFRLGCGRDGFGRLPGRGPEADRADRTGRADRTNPPRRQTARRRRHRGAGGAGSSVGDSSDVSFAGRARDRIARTDRLDVAASLAGGLPRRHRRPTSRAIRVLTPTPSCTARCWPNSHAHAVGMSTSTTPRTWRAKRSAVLAERADEVLRRPAGNAGAALGKGPSDGSRCDDRGKLNFAVSGSAEGAPP